MIGIVSTPTVEIDLSSSTMKDATNKLTLFEQNVITYFFDILCNIPIADHIDEIHHENTLRHHLVNALLHHHYEQA
jgi:hypothetical protein